jgi:hypothetical protein
MELAPVLLAALSVVSDDQADECADRCPEAVHHAVYRIGVTAGLTKSPDDRQGFAGSLSQDDSGRAAG